MAFVVHVSSCRFLRLGCRNDAHELFSSSYVRSNKKRSSKPRHSCALWRKLLRCFPHCCPDHVTRSYCGCSLHVLVTFASADETDAAERNDDLIVCARFETAASIAVSGAGEVVTAYPTDSIVALSGGATQQSKSSSVGNDWLRAEKASGVYQRQLPVNTILYVLNNHRNPHWYYGYESGSTKAQREMKHVLAAYVFLLHPLAERRRLEKDGRGTSVASPVARLATVVTRLASPAFTMISYRRQNSAHRRARLQASAKEDTVGDVFSDDGDGVAEIHTMAVSEARKLIGSPATLAAGFKAIPTAAEYQSGLATTQGGETPLTSIQAVVNETKEDASVRQVAESSTRYSSQAPPQSLKSRHLSLTCLICRGPLALRSHTLHHHGTIERLQSLLLLHLFVRSAPLRSFTFYFSQMDLRIQRRWLAKIPPVNQTEKLDTTADSAARMLVTEIASAFSLSNLVWGCEETEAAVAVNPVREQAVLRSCADLLLDAFSSLRVQQILSAVLITGQAEGRPISPLSDLCTQFGQLITDLFEEFSQLLAARSSNNSNFGERSHFGHVSVPALVDDILSLVYAEPKYSPLRSTASALLLRRDESFERASQTLFRAFLEQLKQGRGNVWSHEQCADVSVRVPVIATSTNAEASVLISTAKDPIPSRPAQLADSRHQREVAVSVRAKPSTNEWGRRWFLVPSSVSIVPLDIAPSDERNNVDLNSPNAPRDFSMLTAIALVRMLASVDVVLEGTRLTVRAATPETFSQLPATSSTALELDGQLHAFESFPNGWSVAAGSALLGDPCSFSLYEGRVADDGISLDLLLFSLPTSPAQSQLAGPSGDSAVLVTRRVRARLVLGRGRREDEGCVSVFAEVCVAPSQLPSSEQPSDWRHFLDEMSAREWSPTLETHATYVAWL